MTFGGELQRNLILIVVALIVATKAHEHCQLIVLQLCGVLLQCVGMHKHLYSFILTKVERGLLINSLCLTVG